MHRPKYFFYIFTILAILALALAGTVALNSLEKAKQQKKASNHTLEYSYKVFLDGIPLSVALARTPQEQETGLSFQKDINENQGLLFLFQPAQKVGIWMKDMSFPIDVFWIDEKNTVIFMKENFEPTSYPEILYPPVGVRYVLETRAGFAKNHQIKIGSSLQTLPKNE